MSGIKKGNPVEFIRERRAHANLGEGEFGIAIEDGHSDGSVIVELADGTNYLAMYVIAYAWAGWLPEDLEAAYEKHNPGSGGEDF